MGSQQLLAGADNAYVVIYACQSSALAECRGFSCIRNNHNCLLRGKSKVNNWCIKGGSGSELDAQSQSWKLKVLEVFKALEQRVQVELRSFRT